MKNESGEFWVLESISSMVDRGKVQDIPAHWQVTMEDIVLVKKILSKISECHKKSTRGDVYRKIPIADRDELLDLLKKAGIDCGIDSEYHRMYYLIKYSCEHSFDTYDNVGHFEFDS